MATKCWKELSRVMNPDKQFRQSNHTLANIWQAMNEIFVQPKAVKSALLRMAEYIVLDAVIGNTDRHHENWGILRKRVGDGWKRSNCSFIRSRFLVGKRAHGCASRKTASGEPGRCLC